MSSSPTSRAASAPSAAALWLFSISTVVLVLVAQSANRAETPGAIRQRTSINDDWRFRKGDPSGVPGALMYDVRPQVTDRNDDKPAETEPTAAADITTRAQSVLKPWILPTGNPFITDPANRHARPDGDPGADVLYVKAGFDDSAWQRVNLPHDWAITGPFIIGGSGGSMGRLPISGVGWYRRS